MSTYSHHSSAEGHSESGMEEMEPGGEGEWQEAQPQQPQTHQQQQQQHHQQPLAQNLQQLQIAQQPGSAVAAAAAAAPARAPAAAASAGASSTSASSSSSAAAFHTPPMPAPTLYAFLLNTPLNSILASFLATRDLFFLQFLNRSCFTLLNSNAALLQQYYSSARLDSFIPFMVDDAFILAFLTPTYLALADGSTAVRNTYSMHIRHMRLNFCTRISNRAMQAIATHIGPRLLSINLEGGGRSRVNETGMRTLFASCNNLTSVNLNGFYQLNMVDTIGSLMQHCAHSLTDLSLNGCAQLNDAALGLLSKAKLQCLYLNCSNVTDASLQHLAASFKEQLRILHIAYCGSVTDRGIAALVNYCRCIQDLNLYGCTGLSRHSLSYLRLCPLLRTVDISRIHSLDDSSIAEWILPTAKLQQQQQVILQLIASTPGGPSAAAAQHPDLNPNLPQIFAAQQQNPNVAQQQQSVALLSSVSLDSCSRISSLGLKVLLEHCPSLTFLNAFGMHNLSLLGLQSLLRIAVTTGSPLQRLEIGGCAALNPAQVDTLRKEFPKIAF